MIGPVIVFGAMIFPSTLLPVHHAAPAAHHAVHHAHHAAATVRAAQVAPTATPTQTPTQQPGYLGDVFGGGTGNPCNFASGYQFGVCNPTGQSESEYVANPGGIAPGTPTNTQGCYYVRMGEGYCPSTGQDIPMQDPNQ